VQATFRQVLAEEKPSALAPKPTTPPRRRR